MRAPRRHQAAGRTVAVRRPHVGHHRIGKIADARQDATADGRGRDAEPLLCHARSTRGVARELFLDVISGRNTAYLCAVSRDSCRVVRLPGLRSPSPDRIELYVQAMGGRVEGAPDDPANLAGIQAALGAVILGRVDDLVAASERVIIAPDAHFSSVPFTTLIAPGIGRELGSTVDIQRVPSATILKLLRRAAPHHATAERRLLAVGPVAADLAGARAELRFLEKTFPGDVLAVTGKRATLSALAEPRDIVHFAAHVEVHEEKPWRSGIRLGRPDVDPAIPSDPYLRASEVASMRLPATLAVLSGCESALGRASTGEGVLGLSSAFLSAGTRAVVVQAAVARDREEPRRKPGPSFEAPQILVRVQENVLGHVHRPVRVLHVAKGADYTACRYRPSSSAAASRAAGEPGRVRAISSSSSSLTIPDIRSG